MNEKIKSTKISGVDCKIGRRSRTGSTVTMAVTDQFIMEAVGLFETLEKGEKPKEGLVGLELHAVYAEELEEGETAKSLLEGMEKELDLSEGEDDAELER